MRPSKVLLASVFITAAILIVVGGIATMAFANRAPAAAVSASTGAETGQMDPQREDAYNQLVQQANQQLEQANAELQALQSQVTQLQQGTTGASQQAAFTPDKAAEIARQVAGKGRITVATPELVSFEGKPAYEVIFNQGSIYIDAQSGAVLYNGTVPQTISADKAAQVAAEYLHLTEILQVDQVTIGNLPRYRIIFGDGTMAWVDLTGQIIDVQFKVQASANNQQAFYGGGNAPVVSAESNDDHGDN